jgi:hypothetical protein
MKTTLLTTLLLFGMCTIAHAQTATRDSVAVLILDRMANTIGELSSCSFHLETEQDVQDNDLNGLVKRHRSHDVSMVGPDKMLVQSRGEGGHRGSWYDGKKLSIYSYDESNYVTLAAPPTIIATIDSLHNEYGIDFPAADFIYPTFVSDLLAQSDRVIYRGMATVAGKECLQIATRGPALDMQIWVANDAMMLPVKYVIREHGKSEIVEYEGVFSDWQINPDLPESIFSFLPPPGAHEIAILSRDQRISGGGR